MKEKILAQMTVLAKERRALCNDLVEIQKEGTPSRVRHALEGNQAHLSTLFVLLIEELEKEPTYD